MSAVLARHRRARRDSASPKKPISDAERERRRDVEWLRRSGIEPDPHRLPDFGSGFYGLMIKALLTEEASSDAAEHPDGFLESAEDAAAAAQEQTTCENVRHAVGKLRGRERKVIELVMQGLSQRDIAARLGISQMTVQRAFQSAAETLREELSGE